MAQLQCSACRRFLALPEKQEEASSYLCPACGAEVRFGPARPEPIPEPVRQTVQSPARWAAPRRPTAKASDKMLETGKAERDRVMRKVVSCGVLLILAACGGGFWWLVHDRRSQESPSIAAPNPEAERQHQEKKEADEREAARQATARFVSPLLPLTANCPVAENPRTLQRRQKVLIWDTTANAPSTANARLPDALRGQTTDTELTLAVVLRKNNVQVTTYDFLPIMKNENNKVPGYRVDLDVCLIDVAQKKALGRVSLVGEEPPASIKRGVVGLTVTDTKPEYGDSDGPLARWLESRPRAGQLDRIEAARQKVEDCRDRGPVAARTQGKVLIWDMEKDVPSAANQHVPEARRGTLDDQDLTLVLVAERKQAPVVVTEALFHELFEMEKAEKKLGDATLAAGTPGAKVYREKVELCIVSFPKNEALGTTMVDGAFLVVPAPGKEQSAASLSVGNSEKEMARWVEGRVALPAP